MCGKVLSNAIYMYLYPQLVKFKGRVYLSQQTVSRAFLSNGEMLCLKLHPQFSSYLNETCSTWSLWCVDVHDIILFSHFFEILIYP